jgi:hypothetical protein
MRQQRGQLLLVGALALSFTFIALGLIVNSAIFTENLASRGDITGGENIAEYHDAVRRGTGRLLVFENHNISSSDDRNIIWGRVKDGVPQIQSTLTRQAARRGVSANASVIASTNGSRIFQNESRSFTNGTGNGTWTLASNVDNTRAFRLNISRANTSTESACGGLFANCSAIRLENGSTTWQVSIATNGANETVVGVDNGTDTTRCDPVGQPFLEADLTAGTVAGETCPALAFADAPASGYDIRYENGSELVGTYSLVVDNTALAEAPPSDYTSGPQPSVLPAVYGVTLAYHYQAADVYMKSQVRVAPGESDA